MNTIYKHIWSRTLGRMVVVSELAKGGGRKAGRRRLRLAGLVALALTLTVGPQAALARVTMGGGCDVANICPDPNPLSGNWDMSTTTLVIGVGDSGGLQVDQGHKAFFSDVYIGQENGWSNSMSVLNSGSYIGIGGGTGRLRIGSLNAGGGTLHIGNGGTVENGHATIGFLDGVKDNANGKVYVDDSSAKWNVSGDLTIGESKGGFGLLEIRHGGTVTSSGSIYIGKGEGTTGIVTVTDGGSHWNTSNQNINIGRSGAGTLNILNGGLVSSRQGVIGSTTGGSGTVIVSGPNSKWDTGSWILYMGAATNSVGSLTLSEGGDVTAGTIDLASGSGSTATLNIGAAEGSAAAAAGTLTGSSALSFNADNTGTLVFNHTDTDYDFSKGFTGGGVNSTIKHLAGVTTLTANSTSFAGTTSVSGGTLKVNNLLGGDVTMTDGTLGGSGTLLGNVTVTSGTLAPGNSPGTLTFAGDLNLTPDSILNFELGDPSGTAGVASDLIVVNGALTLDGTLNVLAEPDFGVGLYRLIDYSAGSLAADNGLDLGTTPDGFDYDYTVQTNTTNKHVNLLVENIATWDGSTLHFWEGNGAGGGDGIWTLDNTNWDDSGTDVTTDNTAMQIFDGTPGTVTVDNSDGQVKLSRAQFAADGYSIDGEDLRLVGLATVRVGDGTAAGADYTATIDTNLVGNGTLIKNDLGRLILNGANTYTGGTTVKAGTLELSGSLASAVNLEGGWLLTGLTGSAGTINGDVTMTGGVLGGSGTINGDVTVTSGTVGPGNSPGTLTINGDFNLTSDSILDFELGDPDGVAGTDSDLIDVNGDLTLDGTLNVTALTDFGMGTYRLIDYSGALTDNGLDIGTTPDGFLTSDLTLQTATANQINLLVGTPSGLSFWDGSETSVNNLVDGGAGTWHASNTNWTGGSGGFNGTYNPNVLHIFQGSAGTITVGNSDGQIVTSGLQFAVDGYSIEGDDLEISGAATMRVGDGTAAGSGYTATIDSDLIGTGSLEKTDLGTLILTGANTYTGGTTITAGTLQGDTTSLQGDITNNAALVFDQAMDDVWGGTIDGNGNLTKSGAGALKLSGDSSGFTGTTTISGGSLYVNGSLGGAVDVAGGILGGSGMLTGGLTVNSGGTLAPGNSIGTVNVADITFAPGSNYEVELNDGGFVAGTNNDFINATGTATLNGGTVQVTPENGTDHGDTYTLGTYTILTAAGGVTGIFDTLTDDYAFLNFALSYDANNVFLTSSTVTSFCLPGMSANQCAAGDSVFSLDIGNTLFDAVLGLSNMEAPGALAQLSGEIHASTKTMLIEDSRFAREAALGRLRVTSGSAGGNAGGMEERKISDTASVWTRAFGSWGNWSNDGNAARLNRNIGGFFLGSDALVMDDVRLGLMGGYSRSNYKVDDVSASGTTDTYTLGAYAGGQWEALSLKGGLTHSWHSIDTSRSVAFTGFSDSLSASHNARTVQAFSEVAYGFEADKIRIEPFANLAYVRHAANRFTESGGAAALNAVSQTTNVTFTTIGLRTETTMALGEAEATLRGTAGWHHAFGDDTPASKFSFTSAGNTFTATGVPIARDALVVDAGFDVNLTKNATFGLFYGGRFGSGTQDHSASANLNVRF